MERLRQLIHQIHRRSLWQVLGIYVVASWIVFEVVQTLTEGLGLPGWFPSFAFVLLLIGLPIVLATAFVQEGVSLREESDAEGPAPVAPAASLFTWRNALGGGVFAFAAWGVVAAGWIMLGGDGRGATDATADAAPLEQSVAVLPFVNMSGDPDNEYFSDGVTEELLNALAQLPDLRVPGRTSSFAFKGQNLTIRQIADTLNVAHVLEGSVRRDGGRVLITAQLVDALRDRHLWSDTYERDLEDVFAIQREIAVAIARELRVELGGPAPVLTDAAPTTSQEAHDLYLRGRFELNQRGEHVAEAIRYFEQAVESDPSYARAYGGLALARALGGAYGVGDPQGALEAADRALSLDSSLSEPHTALGYMPTRIGGVLAAERELRLAIQLDPNDANAHHFLGWALMARGRWDEAEASVTRAILLDPANPAHRWRRGGMYFLVGRWADAEADARDALRIAPDDRYALQVLTQTLGMSGQLEALSEVAPDDDPFVQLLQAVSLTSDSARIDEALHRFAEGNVLGGAWVAARLDRRTVALDLAERGFRDATSTSMGFNLHATLQSMALTSLRDEPRFQALVERFRLEPI